MIKLIIRNDLYNYETKHVLEDGKWIEKEIRVVRSYDEEKWKDGRIYEFNTLKEVQEFINTCDIWFTDEKIDTFNCWTWEEIDKEIWIETCEDNLIVFCISSHEEIIE